MGRTPKGLAIMLVAGTVLVPAMGTQAEETVFKSAAGKAALIEALDPSYVGIQHGQPRSAVELPSTSQPRCVLQSQSRAASLPVFFELDSAELTPETRHQLDDLGAALQSPRLRGCIFVIEGHTDAFGDNAYNMHLSEQRAEAVRDYLVRNYGLGRDRVVATGKGESEPLNPQDPEAAENRRVKIINIGS